MSRRCPDCDATVGVKELAQSGRDYCPHCGLILGGGRPDPPLYARGDLDYSALGGGA